MKIVVLGMETMMSRFSEPAREANFRGGLGILNGDIASGFSRLIKSGLDFWSGTRMDLITPVYHYHWKTREEVPYGLPAKKVMELNPQVNSNPTIKVLDIEETGALIHCLECPSVFQYLYDLDRWRRLQQEVVFAKTVSLLLKNLEVKPDIVWLQESHTALVLEIREDPYFKGTKILFTIHTKSPAGMERFPEQWFMN